MYARPFRRTIRQFLSRFFNDFSEFTIFMPMFLDEDRNIGKPLIEVKFGQRQGLRAGHSPTDSYDAAARLCSPRRSSGMSLRPERKDLMLRVAWRRRWRFSTRAIRTKPSPYSPQPIPGDTATLARSSSNFEKARLPIARKAEGIGAQANIVASGSGIGHPAWRKPSTSTSRRAR